MGRAHIAAAVGAGGEVEGAAGGWRFLAVFVVFSRTGSAGSREQITVNFWAWTGFNSASWSRTSNRSASEVRRGWGRRPPT